MSISGDSNGNGNGGDRGSWHPDAVAELAAVTAAKQSADEAWIQRVDDNVAKVADALDEFRTGHTVWQQDVSSKLKTISNQVLALTNARLIRPALWLFVTAAATGAAVDLIWHLASK